MGLSIELTRPTALLYIDGVTSPASDLSLYTVAEPKFTAAIKTTSSYALHSWAFTFANRQKLVYANTVSGTCAAGVQAIYEANQILEMGIAEEVIIIGAERIGEDTLRLFKEVRAPIVCGDGFAYMRLEKGDDISDIKWRFKHSDNPFFFDRKTINGLCPENYKVDNVKPHGTGTPSNNEAEAGIEMLGKVIKFKPDIGHTQGVSALLETCMLLDHPDIIGNTLIAANGLGGFYGSFTLSK